MHAISAAAQHRIEAVAQGNGGCFDNNLGYFQVSNVPTFYEKKVF